MSDEENVAIVKRAYGIWRDQGLEGLRSQMHDEVEWHPPPQAPEPGPFRGPDEILRVASAYMESFGEFRPVPDRVLPGADPDQIVVLATLTTVGRQSGAEFSMPVAHLLTLREGKVARFQVFTDQAQALAAAGLEPDQGSSSQPGAVALEVLDAYNRHDAERMKALLAPEGEIYGLRFAIEGTVYRGREGLVRFWSDIDEIWGRVRAEDPEVLERGSEALTICRLILEGRGSGVLTERRVAVHIELDERGLVRRFLTLTDADAARRDFEGGARLEPG